MNALDILRVLRRHPFVLVFLLILTAAGAGLVYMQLPINYQSTTSEILLPSKYVTTVTSGKATTTIVNPYTLTGDHSAQITAITLVDNANGSKFQRDLRNKGVTSTPSIAISATGGGVTIDVAATDRQAGATSKDLPIIVSALSNQLLESQRAVGGPERSFYGLQVVNPQDTPSQVSSGRFKTSVISGVLGIIVTLVIILIYDAQLRRRPRGGRRRTDGSGRKRPAPEADAAEAEAAVRYGARRDGDRQTVAAVGANRGAAVPGGDRPAGSRVR